MQDPNKNIGNNIAQAIPKQKKIKKIRTID